MANTVAYPDLALEKFIGIDSSEVPTAFIRLLEKKIGFSLGSRPATNEHNIQRRKERSFRSCLTKTNRRMVWLTTSYYKMERE